MRVGAQRLPGAKSPGSAVRPGALKHRHVIRLRASGKQGGDARTDDGPTRELGTGLKATWYLAEVLGSLSSLVRGKAADAAAQTQDAPASEERMTLEEVVSSIRKDYETDYFISGEGEMAAYAPDCLFADPFVSFRGTERFKKNVGNLGVYLRDVDLAITGWSQNEDGTRVTADWRFSAILDLPWRPRLAAAGCTTHVIDPQKGLVVEHLEQWKSEPGEVVARLIKPSARVPGNAWEAFMGAASAGDAKGMWFVLSARAAALGGALLGVELVSWLLTGHSVSGALDFVAGSLVVAGLATEVIKFAQGMQGGETGTGGRF